MCVFTVTSLWSWVVAAVKVERRRVVVWDLSRSWRRIVVPPPEAFPFDSNFPLSVEGDFLNPVKASVDQSETVAINQFQLHVDLVVVHLAI